MRNVIYCLLFLLFLCLLWYIFDSCAVQAHVEQSYNEAFGFLPFAVGLGASLVGNGISNWLSSGNSEHMQTLSYQDNMNLQHDAQNFNSLEANKNRVYNTAERQAAQQFTEDMWNKNNAYNTPSAQVDRLRAAGLNPLSATMQSSNAQLVGASPQASGTAASSPANSVGIPGTQSFGFASDFANLSAAAAQVQNLDAQTDLLTIDKITRLDQNFLELAKGRAIVANSNMDTKDKEKLLQLYDSHMEKNYSEGAAATLNAHTNQQRMLNEYDISMKELELKHQSISVDQFVAATQRMLANSTVKLNNSQIKEIYQRVANLRQEWHKISHESDMTYEQFMTQRQIRLREEVVTKFAMDNPLLYNIKTEATQVIGHVIDGAAAVHNARTTRKSVNYNKNNSSSENYNYSDINHYQNYSTPPSQ